MSADSKIRLVLVLFAVVLVFLHARRAYTLGYVKAAANG